MEGEIQADGTLPWTTGLKYFDLAVLLPSIYNHEAALYDQFVTAGPSGNTDLHLDNLMMFNF